MSEVDTVVTVQLERLLSSFWHPPQPLWQEVVDDIHARGWPTMQISFEQAALHGWLARLVGARKVLEVGTYMGLSAIVFATAIGDGGTVDSCELSEERAQLARQWISRAGVADRVTVHVGFALETVARLPGPFDLAFLDADKRDNLALLRLIVPKLSTNGLVLADNVFRGGDLGSEQPDSRAMREYLDAVRLDPRLDTVVLRVADGLAVSRLRS